MTTLSQRSFTSGELAPALYARVDFFRYATGLRTCRNCIILRYGGAANRPGTKFVQEVNDSSSAVRLIPYVISNNISYVLEFGNQYMRVIRNGEQIVETAVNISAATQANPVVITTSGSHSYTTGDEVYISGIIGMTELNNRNFKITVTGATTFSLQAMDGVTNINGSGYTAYSSGGTSERVYEITTDYVSADLEDIKYAQTEDAMVLTHKSYFPQQLTRTSDTSWTIQDYPFAPNTAKPGVIATVSGTAPGSVTTRYIVTAVDEFGVESLPVASGGTKSISSITQANPPVVTTGAAHGYETGDLVELELDASSTPAFLDNKQFKITVITSTTFSLQGIDLSNETISLAGTNNSRLVYASASGIGTPTAANPTTITWSSSADAIEYNLYKWSNGSFGLLAITDNTEFDDIGESVDTSIAPPVETHRFNGSGNYPQNVTYVQQRLTFSNTTNNPERVFMSRTGDLKNFYIKKPVTDDSAIIFDMSGSKLSSVQSVLDLGKMIIMTESGEWSVTGGDNAVITPTTIDLKQDDYNGSDRIQPVVVNGSSIYVQARGSTLRDFNYKFSSDGYSGNDLTLFSAHLFDGYTIKELAYQQIPHSILWVVRSDGVLLGLTLIRDQQVLAWHRHDFSGTVENIAVVPESSEDVLYVTVKRTINGNIVRFVERMSSRLISDVKDSKFMDSYLTYDGRNTGSTTMTLSGGSTWAYDETLTLTASASYFSSDDVGDQIFLRGASEELIRFEIEVYSSATVVTGKPHKTVPADLRTTATTDWDHAVSQVTGLWHLEGEDVSVFGDGFVAASPNNDSYTTVTVASGTITLDKPYAVIHAGIPYLSDIETLDIDTASGETLADKYKIVGKVNMYLQDTRGVWVGPKPPTSDTVDPLENLVELKIRNTEDYESPVSLKTDVEEVIIQGEWNSNGRVFIRQVDPVPMTILSVNPAGKYPFGG